MLHTDPALEGQSVVLLEQKCGYCLYILYILIVLIVYSFFSALGDGRGLYLVPGSWAWYGQGFI